MKIIEIIYDKDCRLKPTQQQMQDLKECIRKLDVGLAHDCEIFSIEVNSVDSGEKRNFDSLTIRLFSNDNKDIFTLQNAFRQCRFGNMGGGIMIYQIPISDIKATLTLR